MLHALFALFLTVSRPASAQSFVEAPALNDVEWIEGSAISLEEDRVYVVEMWATWCGPCIEQMPHLNALQKEYGERLTVVAISDESTPVVKRFLSRRSVDYAVGVDPSGDTSMSYHRIAGEMAVPQAFIVKEGKVVWTGHPGNMDEVLSEVMADRWTEKRASDRAALPALIDAYFGNLRDRDAPAARAVGEEFVQRAALEPNLLNAFAWEILTDDVPGKRRLC